MIDFVKQARKNNDLVRKAIWALRVALPNPAPEPFESKPLFPWAFYSLTQVVTIDWGRLSC